MSIYDCIDSPERHELSGQRYRVPLVEGIINHESSSVISLPYIHCIARIPPLLHNRNKFVNGTWPASLFIPPAHALVGLGLLDKQAGLIPKVLAHRFLPF